MILLLCEVQPFSQPFHLFVGTLSLRYQRVFASGKLRQVCLYLMKADFLFLNLLILN